MTAIITSDLDCANQALVAAVFAEHLGNCVAAEALYEVAALLSARQSTHRQDFHPRVDSMAGDNSPDEHPFRSSLTIRSVPLPLPNRGWVTQGQGMGRHRWLNLVLKNIVTYAAVHKIDQVSRHAAKALYALELQEYEDERKARILTRRPVEADLALVSDVVRANGAVPTEAHQVILW